MKSVVEPRREESEERPVSNADSVHPMRKKSLILRVSPIDENARIDHQKQQREIDPMHPAGRKWMPVFDGDRLPLALIFLSGVIHHHALKVRDAGERLRP